MAAATGRNTFDAMGDPETLTSTSQTSGSGTTLSSLSGGAGNTKTSSSSAAVRGARGLTMVGNGVSSFMSYTFTATSGAGAEEYVKFDSTALPTVDAQILQIRNSGGGACSLTIKSTGVWTLTNAAGGLVDNMNGNTALPTGQYRVYIGCEKGTTTSNGRITWELTNAVTGAIVDSGDTGTTANSGTTDYVEARYGKGGASGNYTFVVDEVAYRVGDATVIDFRGFATSDDDDPVGITDSVVALKSNANSASDNVGVTDSVTAIIAKTVDLVDGVGIFDPGMTSDAANLVDLSDIVGATDTQTNLQSRTTSVDDLVGISDDDADITYDASRDYSFDDAVGISDALTAIILGASPIDNLGITDDVTVEITRAPVVSDPVGITDTVTADHTTVPNVADNVGITDLLVFDTVRSLVANVSDALGITDNAVAGSSGVGVPGATVGTNEWMARQFLAHELSITPEQSAPYSVDTLWRMFYIQELGLTASQGASQSLSDLARAWVLVDLPMSVSAASGQTTDYLIRLDYNNDLGLSTANSASLSDADLEFEWLSYQLGV